MHTGVAFAPAAFAACLEQLWAAAVAFGAHQVVTPEYGGLLCACLADGVATGHANRLHHEACAVVATHCRAVGRRRSPGVGQASLFQSRGQLAPHQSQQLSGLAAAGGHVESSLQQLGDASLPAAGASIARVPREFGSGRLLTNRHLLDTVTRNAIHSEAARHYPGRFVRFIYASVEFLCNTSTE